MNLQTNAEIAEGYTSNSQKVRVITENWVADNLYCPFCGNLKIRHFENNRPVADLYGLRLFWDNETKRLLADLRGSGTDFGFEK